MLDLGRYKLTKLIATGGMAKVYNAVDSKGEFKNIAAKVPLDFVLAQPQYLKRFQNEAKISLKFKHPNIMRMFDAGTHEGMPYMIMEFIDGMALEDLQEKKKIFTIKEAIPLILDLLDAIKHMHNYRDEDISSSIVHRDLSPQNVIIRNDGRVVLMDFGIAKTKSLTSVTMGTATIGKPYYMAPEQVQSKDSSNIDKRADIYAVGVMLYEMLTGKKPFEGSNPFQVMEKVRNPKFTARPPHELNPDIPKGISEIIMRTMHKNREQRFQSAEELMAALKKGRDTSEAKKINQIIACMVTLAVLMIATGITGLVFSVKTRNKELAAIPLEICPHGVTNKNSISLSGWSLPDNKIRIYNRDRYDEKILSSQGYFKFDNIQLNPGENVLRPVLMSMDDQVISRGSTFCHIIYDIIPPDKPKILTETKITPKREISIRGITEPHSSVMVTFASNESKLFGPFKDGTFEISGLTLAQGPNTFKTAGIDAAGNTSEITIFNIHSDTVIPDAPVFPSKSMYVNENNTIISGRAEAFSKIAVQYKKTVHNVQTGAQGVFHADLKNILADFSVLQEKGFAEVTFKTIDRAGNISKNPVTLNINYLPFDSFSLQAIPFYTNNDVLKLKLKGPSGKSITINYNSNSISDTLISDDYSEFPLGLNPGINNIDLKIEDYQLPCAIIIFDNQAPELPDLKIPEYAGEKTHISGFAEALSLIRLSSSSFDKEMFADSFGFFEFENIELQKGENVFDLEISDHAGNSTFLQDHIKIISDREPPQIILNKLPQIIPYDVFDISGKSKPFTSITVQGEHKKYSVYSDKDGLFSIPGIRVIESHDNKFTVTAVDRAGNKSVNPVEFSVILDVIPPEAPVFDTLPNKLDTTRSVDVTGSSEKNSEIHITVQCYNDDGPYTYRTEIIKTDDNGIFQMSGLKLNVGKNTIIAQAADAAGHFSNKITAADITVDLTLPDAPRLNIENTNFSKPIVNIPVMAVPDSEVLLISNKKEFRARADSKGSALVKDVTLMEGKNNIQITCIDSTGLESPETYCQLFLDLVKPDKPKLAALAPVTSKSSLTIDGTVNEVCTITLEVLHMENEEYQDKTDTLSPEKNGQASKTIKKRTVYTKKIEPMKSSENIKTDASDALKIYDFKFLSVSLNEGVNHISAWSQDPAGNTSEAYSLQKVILDTIPPVPPELIDVPAKTEQAEINIIGTAEPDSIVTIYVNDDIFETPSGISGNFSKSITLKEGDNSVTATAKDTTGNVSGISKSFNILCSIPPEPPVFANLPSSIPDKEFLISGIAEKNSSISIKVNDKTYTTECAQGEFKCKIELLKGKNLVSAYTVDSFGNRSVDSKTHEIYFERVGIISVNSSPSSASFYINDKLIGTTPINTLKVEPGNITFALKKQAYKSREWTKRIEINDRFDFSYILDQEMLPLNIDTQPPGADVYIDGTLMGKTPFRSNSIPAGTHEMLLRLPNYIEKSHRFDLLRENDFSFNFDLEPVMALLRLSCNVDEAKVVINNKTIGMTPLSDIKLPLGEHMVVITKPGYTSFKRRIIIDSEEEFTLSSSLKKQEYHIEVKCKIEGAKVFLNGQPIGITPVEPVKVQSPGEYILTVEKEGYQPYKRTIDIFETGYTTKSVRLFQKTSFIVERRKSLDDREMREVYDDGDNSIWLARDIKLTDKEVKGTLELSKNDTEDWLKIIFDSSGYFYASLKGNAQMQVYRDDESFKIGSPSKSASRIQMDSGQILYFKIFNDGTEDVDYTLINSFRAHSTGDGF